MPNPSTLFLHHTVAIIQQRHQSRTVVPDGSVQAGTNEHSISRQQAQHLDKHLRLFVCWLMQVQVSYRGQCHAFTLPDASTVAALKDLIHESLDLPPGTQKLLAKGKVAGPDSIVQDGTRFMLLATSAESISAVSTSLARSGTGTGTGTRGTPGTRVGLNRTIEPATPYIFDRIVALPHLPSPSTSQTFLERLARDAAIRHLMRRRHLRVALLTELDPRAHTTHDSKVLGLNRNAGEQVLLRVRTDTLDGWRDYRTVRATLVHELAHNTHTDHDRAFWDLFNAMSREVAEFESGRAMAPGEVFVPKEAKESDLGAEWTGGTGKLGRNGDGPGPALEGREARARAAEERSREPHA
ncbi:putative Zinc metalloproteinase [Taphrina deformans PYCC 5710]|uniref:Zinc metalloproteinase n=1 Tax=Taphrina deformans (strain PYCC 5710 / ATCC 11124 / CBS 356.35 / IMI 108563 / JCM 9778 / NBRC 8474) TaxID=1097556 RepID=R4XDG1_TAPDE|nr:putative Zinc metalloproteinase [Taphrina deformans PYCC 5710]|eukprot:CCG82448.1 putative Zinc metalloproteinase [Taphrina deformans PYCC 5710]